ncbi:MAG: SET domain-containing protein-lysine N-methyltransferase [bacterium]|nr:SET domain-containing protein-lysine N-methyltransferase [bacterium]
MNKNVIVKKSEINKKGVFAAKDFKKDEIVLEWNPKILKKSEVEKLKSNQKHYLYKVGKDKYFLMRSPEKFVNHSCEANTRVKNNCDIAIKNIKKDEEITSDYGKGNLTSFKCKCGGKNCRGVIEFQL